MTEYYEIVKNFLGKNNWVNTIVLIVMAFSFNSKLNTLLITDSVNNVKINEIERRLDDYDKTYHNCSKTISVLTYNLKSHLGDAYIREEEIN